MQQINDDFLIEIAVLYYYEKYTQEQLAKKYGLSRIKIGRLIHLAKDRGLVEIHIKNNPFATTRLENLLMQKFNLGTVIIAPNFEDKNAQRKALAYDTLLFLAKLVKDEMFIAVGEGRNIAAMADNEMIFSPINCKFVCAIGGTHRANNKLDSDYNSKGLAKKFNATSETLYAPAYVEKPSHRKILVRNGTIKRTLDYAKQANIAIIGIGNMSGENFMSQLDWFPEDEIITAREEAHIVGDMAGTSFFDIDGKMIKTSLNDRVIGLTAEDLYKIPNVIAIASEYSKKHAILGALRTGVINSLAITRKLAENILELHSKQ